MAIENVKLLCLWAKVEVNNEKWNMCATFMGDERSCDRDDVLIGIYLLSDDVIKNSGFCAIKNCSNIKCVESQIIKYLEKNSNYVITGFDCFYQVYAIFEKGEIHPHHLAIDMANKKYVLDNNELSYGNQLNNVNIRELYLDISHQKQ